MKKRLLILLFCFGLSALGFAQETAEPTVFDYAKTKHELSLNIAPVLVGEYPFDLLFRKHYVNKNGKNVALRLGASLNANLGSFETDNPGGNSQSNNGQTLQAYIGKEWQRTFHPRIIGYYGTDLSVGYGRYSNDVTPNDPSQVSGYTTHSVANLGAVGFLGMKYHFSKHFSLSVETSAQLNFSRSIESITESTQTAFGEQTTRRNNFALSMSPLRAIRFAFHF